MKRWRTKLSTLVAATTLAALVPVAVLPASGHVAADDSVFISEIHYDNASSDVGEAFEVFGPAGTDLSSWTVVLYNGNGGSAYNTIALSGTITDMSGGFGVISTSLPSNGLQNGSPDGLALVDGSGVVRQFLSYEGAFAAVGGAADGLTSTDIGVSESSSTPIGHSLQIGGSGVCYEDLTWNAPAANTFGALGPITPVVGDPCDTVVEPPLLPEVRFSEIHYDNSGTDSNEAIEVFGPANFDLTGWSVVLYNGSSSSSTGLKPYSTTALSGTIPDLDGTSGVVVVDYPSNGIQNGSPDGFALVDGIGAVVEFLSYEGTFEAIEGPATGLTSTDIGASESSGTAANQSLQRDTVGDWSGPLCASFGEINDPAAPVDCPIPPVEVFIHDVQGPGASTPLNGVKVLVEGVVTADYQGAGHLYAFFVQEEDADADGDPMTSEGVFVFDRFADVPVDVNVGDVVRVTGTASEFFNKTQISAESVTVIPAGEKDRTVSPTEISFPVANLTDHEPYEGMSIVVPQGMTIDEYFNFDRRGEVLLTTERLFQPTAVFAPGSADGLALAASNRLAQIVLDDGISGGANDNPDPAIHPDGHVFDLTHRFRGGDVITNLTGVMDYAFGSYRIQPTDGADHADAGPRPASHDPVGGRLEVASYNVLNYFSTLDGSGAICGPLANQGCRGADNAEEFTRQRDKIISAIDAIDADVVGLMEIENHATDAALQDLVDGLNAVAGAGTYAFVGSGPAGDDVIRVGILYKPATVSPVGGDAVLDDPAFVAPFGTPRNRAAQAQMFEEIGTGETFSVVVNHLKSKGSPCGAPDDDPIQGNCNTTREVAAEYLADWIANDAYFAGDSDVLIVGDLNAYDKEDPITALKDAGYADLLGNYQGEFAYTYVFSGQWGYLDYAMANSSLASQVTGTTAWHINADEPDILDYDTSFKKPAQDALYEANPYRSSDHDPVIVGLDLDQTPPEVDARFDTLNSSNNTGLFIVRFECTDNVDPSPTCVADINGTSVVDGQVVFLIENPGKEFTKWTDGVLHMKSSAFVLTVTGTDAHGNSTTIEIDPVFTPHWQMS